jgi:apolipoprotein N-acyltransferase
MTNLLGSALYRGPKWLSSAAWPWRLLTLAGVGALAGFGQVPFAFPVATLLGLVLAVLHFDRGGAGFGAGFALGLGYFGLTLHWIVEPFLIDPARTGWMAPFALVLTAAGFALFWGAAFGIARRLRLGLLGLAVLWTGVEVLRSLVLTGFPWALVGHVWTETGLVQLASVVGVHGLTLLTLLAAAGIANPRLRPSLRGAIVAALAGGLFVLDPGPVAAPDPGAPVIRVVQPNIPQQEKWDPVHVPEHLQRILSLSGPPPDGAAGEARSPALVVWPETALADLLDWAGPTLEAGVRAAGGAPLATGIARMDAEGRYFNSLAVTNGLGRVVATYDKSHLVPFGEYMPLRETLAAWGLRGIAEFQGAGFSPGAGAALIDIPGLGLARPLICYEGIFAEEIGAGGRPRLLLMVTNDAWFGAFAGPQQHLALGRLRAIEQGLPMVRSANTGISAVIDGKGRVLDSLPLNEAGAMDVPLPPALPPTLYSRAGDAPVLLLLALLGAWALRQRRRNAGLDPGDRGA